MRFDLPRIRGSRFSSLYYGCQLEGSDGKVFALFFHLCGPDCGQGYARGKSIAEDARKLTVNTDARGWPVPRQRQPASIPSRLSAFPPVKAYKVSSPSIPERLKSTGLKLDGPEEYECRLAFPCASLTGGYAAFLWLALHSFHRSR
jgi:hypothetical protein